MQHAGQAPGFSGLARRPPRSIAVEVAVLFLNQIEPQVAQDPKLLVSTEAILSFAIVRQSDRELWAHWRVILARYDQLDLIEHLLQEPPPIASENHSKAARLIRLGLDQGIECFHDPAERGWVSLRSDQHWETYPIRSRAFMLFLKQALLSRDRRGRHPGSSCGAGPVRGDGAV